MSDLAEMLASAKEQGYKEGIEDAIEEFANKIIECATYTETEEGWNGMTVGVEDIQIIAEQLKQEHFANADKMIDEPKWISVEDRLPELGNVVLCANKDGSVFTTCITAMNGVSYKFGKHHFITHWMPLPNPPKSE